jgi:hypothetical protein
MAPLRREFKTQNEKLKEGEGVPAAGWPGIRCFGCYEEGGMMSSSCGGMEVVN